jgi:peroxiredoxin
MKPVLNFLILLGLALSPIRCGKTDSTPGIGKKTANFRLNTLNHERFYLNQNKGKIVILVFWATWCRSCKTEMVVLQNFTTLPGWQDVTVAAVCTDPENLGDVKSIVQNLKISYPVLLDHDARLFQKFQLTAYPTTLIFDRRQRLSFIRVGCDPVVLNQVKSKVISLLQSELK